MRTSALVAGGAAVLLAATACSGGAARVLVQGTRTPSLPPAPSVAASSSPPAHASPTATKALAAPRYGSHAGGTPKSRSAPTPVAKPPTARHSAAPVVVHTAAPAHTPAPKRTVSATACTSTGSTTVMQVTSPDRFAPSSLTVHRCDAVKAVYSDGTGMPHTWQGPGWNSGDLTSNGQSYTYRFTSTGTFNFYCAYHRSIGMTGTITVR